MTPRTTCHRLTALLLFSLGMLSLSLRAQVPQLLNYQGRVSVGTLNFDGSGQFKFALVTNPVVDPDTKWSNDGSSLYGSEPAAAVTLTVTKGLYSVQLGDTTLTNMTALPASAFNAPNLSLRVWFNDGTHGFQLLTPDQRIASVGYAMVAGSVPLGSITATQLAQDLVLGGTTTIESIALLPTGNSSEGLITQDGSSLIHTFGTENFFAGTGSGNFTLVGGYNTTTGYQALSSNTSGFDNTAVGNRALHSNTTGSYNTASGALTLKSNLGGNSNTASGFAALWNNTVGESNTALGMSTLNSNTTGSNNIGVGFYAGSNLTTGSNNIDIGNAGVAAESNTIRIGTTGTHTDTYLTGVIHGDGSGLTGVVAASTSSAPNLKKIALLKWGTTTVNNTFAVGQSPYSICFDGACIWALSGGGNNVVKLDASTGAVLGTYSVPGGGFSICFDGTNIWVSGPGNVRKLSASTGAIIQTIDLADTWGDGMCFDGAAIWVSNRNASSVTKLNAGTGATIGTYSVGTVPYQVCFDGINIWVSNRDSRNLTKLNASTGAVIGTYSITAPGEARAICFDGVNIWVTHYDSAGSISKFNASTGSLVGTYAVGSYPDGVCFDGSSIWVTNWSSSNVMQLDPNTGAIIKTYSGGAQPKGICFDGASVWVGNAVSQDVTKF